MHLPTPRTSRLAPVFAVVSVFGVALRAQEAPTEVPFVVHEWGTFTSLQGSDGVALEGLQHEESHLPDFVHDLASLVELPGQRPTLGLKFPASRVTQKMETPVIYFYTDRPRQVRVDVFFPQGLLTQFYPAPRDLAPPLDKLRGALAAGPLELGKWASGGLGWDVELLPAEQGPPAQVPAVDPDDPWDFARQVGAAWVRRPADEAGGQVEAERYLFYRGLGRFDLPVHVLDGERVVVEGEHALPFALALEVGPAGARFRSLGALEPGSQHATGLGLAERPLRRDVDKVLGAVSMEVLHALTAAGLYEDEARAMVATWSQQWFASPGRRVLWIVPRAVTDGLLPLRIKPTPDETVRVLVGRLEFLDPASEAAVVTALRDRALGDETDQQAAKRRLADLGRFLEPHVRRAMACAPDDPVIQRSAQEVLDTVGGR